MKPYKYFFLVALISFSNIGMTANAASIDDADDSADEESEVVNEYYEVAVPAQEKMPEMPSAPLPPSRPKDTSSSAPMPPKKPAELQGSSVPLPPKKPENMASDMPEMPLPPRKPKELSSDQEMPMPPQKPEGMDGSNESPSQENVKLLDFLHSGKTPKFLRVNISGHNIRTSPRFFSGSSNVSYQTVKGSVFAVTRVIPQKDGAAVGIYMDGKEQWIYLPYHRWKDFQFCESEACFESMSEALGLLSKQINVDRSKLIQCGLANQVGNNFRAAATPVSRSVSEAKKLDKQIAPTARGSFSKKPLWERTKGKIGEQWTQLFLQAMENYGGDLLRINKLSDQMYWCPNFSKLDQRQKLEFWMNVFNGISAYESGYKPTQTFNEKTWKNVRKGPVDPHSYSQGFYQMSYGSSSQRAYRNFCKFSWARDKDRDVSDPSLTIYDVKKQMDCAVGVMNYLVKGSGGLGLSASRGGAKMWSTLRSTNPVSGQIHNNIRRDFKACGTR